MLKRWHVHIETKENWLFPKKTPVKFWTRKGGQRYIHEFYNAFPTNDYKLRLVKV